MGLLPYLAGALSPGCATLRGSTFSPEVPSKVPLLQLVPVASSPVTAQGGDAVHGCPKQVPSCRGLLHPGQDFAGWGCCRVVQPCLRHLQCPGTSGADAAAEGRESF